MKSLERKNKQLPKTLKLLVLPALLACGLPAHAAISCSFTVSAINVAYNYHNLSPTDATGTYTVTCTRSAGGVDPLTYAWRLEANNGANNTGGTSRVALVTGAGPYLTYQLYRVLASGIWQLSTTNSFVGAATFANNATTTYTSGSQNFYFRMPQPTGGGIAQRPVGTYTDSATITLYNNVPSGAALTSSQMPVTASVAADCRISLGSSVGPITFNYVSNQGTALGTNTSVAPTNTLAAIRCNDTLPYTVRLDSTTGTSLGLNYTLSTATGVAPVVSKLVIATGLVQNNIIYGSMAAGQLGNCAGATPTATGCTSTTLRTLYVDF